MRYLKISLLIMAILTMIAPSMAQNYTWGGCGAISITEMTSQSGVFSHIDATRCDCECPHIIAGWFSTAGILPCLVKADGISYTAYGDFSGIARIEKVVLTPDGGATQWCANMVIGKGWRVDVPMGMRVNTNEKIESESCCPGKTTRIICQEEKTCVGLEPGGYSLEWGVWSRDKKNRMMFIIIPINFSSTRLSVAANHLMVQSGCIGGMSDQQVFSLLRGFVPAWATPDPAVMMQQQVVNNLSGQNQPQVAQANPPRDPQPQVVASTSPVPIIPVGPTPSLAPPTQSTTQLPPTATPAPPAETNSGNDELTEITGPIVPVVSIPSLAKTDTTNIPVNVSREPVKLIVTPSTLPARPMISQASVKVVAWMRDNKPGCYIVKRWVKPNDGQPFDAYMFDMLTSNQWGHLADFNGNGWIEKMVIAQRTFIAQYIRGGQIICTASMTAGNIRDANGMVCRCIGLHIIDGSLPMTGDKLRIIGGN